MVFQHTLWCSQRCTWDGIALKLGWHGLLTSFRFRYQLRLISWVMFSAETIQQRCVSHSFGTLKTKCHQRTIDHLSTSHNEMNTLSTFSWGCQAPNPGGLGGWGNPQEEFKCRWLIYLSLSAWTAWRTWRISFGYHQEADTMLMQGFLYLEKRGPCPLNVWCPSLLHHH